MVAVRGVAAAILISVVPWAVAAAPEAVSTVADTTAVTSVAETAQPAAVSGGYIPPAEDDWVGHLKQAWRGFWKDSSETMAEVRHAGQQAKGSEANRTTPAPEAVDATVTAAESACPAVERSADRDWMDDAVDTFSSAWAWIVGDESCPSAAASADATTDAATAAPAEPDAPAPVAAVCQPLPSSGEQGWLVRTAERITRAWGALWHDEADGCPPGTAAVPPPAAAAADNAAVAPSPAGGGGAIAPPPAAAAIAAPSSRSNKEAGEQ